MNGKATKHWSPPPLGLYVHTPFCRTKCPYCDFLSAPIPGSVPDAFVDALVREIVGFEGRNEAATVFFGGGTPSLLAPRQLDRILAALHNRFRFTEPPEVSLETNSDDVTPALVDAWKGSSVNRVSLGVQSFDDRVLRYLGRRHDAATARRACDLVAGRFDNWGLDLIFGAAPLDAWAATLKTAISCAPSHISAYGLTYESGTPFEARADDAVADDAWLALFRETEAALDGYDHYEISNYAQPGRRCRHNLVYWHNEEYAGFGPGAYSFLDGVRARNITDLDTYLANPGERGEVLTLEDREVRVETVIQHLRLRDGLPRAYYAARSGNEVEDDFGQQLQPLIAAGLVERTPSHYRPTAKGYELNNEIGLALV